MPRRRRLDVWRRVNLWWQHEESLHLAAVELGEKGALARALMADETIRKATARAVSGGGKF